MFCEAANWPPRFFVDAVWKGESDPNGFCFHLFVYTVRASNA